jgi:hypothetical protein
MASTTSSRPEAAPARSRMGEWHVTPVSSDVKGGLVSVLAYRGNGKLPDVGINIQTEDTYGDLHLTAAEARRMATALILRG